MVYVELDHHVKQRDEILPVMLGHFFNKREQASAKVVMILFGATELEAIAIQFTV